MVRKWLKAARKKRGYTQQEMADIVGISKPTYCSYELGTRSPKWNTARKIGGLLDFNPVLFFEQEVHNMRTFEQKSTEKITI